ncbi:hypothetical protein BDN70DRAFT_902334, partial [Pholiota conissans]
NEESENEESENEGQKREPRHQSIADESKSKERQSTNDESKEFMGQSDDEEGNHQREVEQPESSNEGWASTREAFESRMGSEEQLHVSDGGREANGGARGEMNGFDREAAATDDTDMGRGALIDTGEDGQRAGEGRYGQTRSNDGTQTAIELAIGMAQDLVGDANMTSAVEATEKAKALNNAADVETPNNAHAIYATLAHPPAHRHGWTHSGSRTAAQTAAVMDPSQSSESELSDLSDVEDD